MCLDFALEINKRYSSCLLIRVKAGLGRMGRESRAAEDLFICLRFPCLGRTAVDMTAAGLGCVASFLSLPACFVSFRVPAFPTFMPAQGPQLLAVSCCLPALQTQIMRI